MTAGFSPETPPGRAGLRILAFAAAVALLSYGQAFFVTIFFSLFLSLALRPFVSLLERARMPRVAATRRWSSSA